MRDASRGRRAKAGKVEKAEEIGADALLRLLVEEMRTCVSVNAWQLKLLHADKLGHQIAANECPSAQTERLVLRVPLK